MKITLLHPVPFVNLDVILPIAGSLGSQKVLGYVDCGTLAMQPWRRYAVIHVAVKLAGGADVLEPPTLL